MPNCFCPLLGGKVAVWLAVAGQVPGKTLPIVPPVEDVQFAQVDDLIRHLHRFEGGVLSGKG